MNKSELYTELRFCRTTIADLLDKLWEFGGNSLGEAEFENHDTVKDARDELNRIDKLISLEQG